MRVLGAFFCLNVWITLFFYFIFFGGGGGSEILIFWGYDDFVDIFGGS